MTLIPLTACVGRATPNGDWTYHLATPWEWLL
jgi:hypothetical protein